LFEVAGTLQVGERPERAAGGDMSITDAKSAQGGETLAKRFADYLNDIDNPADIAVLVRSFELSLRARKMSPKTTKRNSDTVLTEGSPSVPPI
jgi:hypothetical protein